MLVLRRYYFAYLNFDVLYRRIVKGKCLVLGEYPRPLVLPSPCLVQGLLDKVLLVDFLNFVQIITLNMFCHRLAIVVRCWSVFRL